MEAEVKERGLQVLCRWSVCGRRGHGPRKLSGL